MGRFLISVADTGKSRCSSCGACESAALRPGGHGELDFVEDIVSRVEAAGGVGLFRTTTQVGAAVRAACHGALLALKSEVEPQK